METFIAKIKLPQSTIDGWNKVAKLPSAWEDAREDEVIGNYSTSYSQYTEVDLKLVNGDEESGPYIEAVWFHKGYEIGCSEPTDSLDCDFVLEVEDHGAIYILKVEAEN